MTIRRKYAQTPARDAGVPLLGTLLAPVPAMSKLRDFYRRYRQYILTDGLMYVVFIVFLALLFVFFG